jgi:hypothetical protein
MKADVIYTAVVWESERGWGRKVDETREFKTEGARDKFIEKFNSKNNEPVAPDWYMFAERGENIIRPIRLRRKARSSRRAKTCKR